MIESQHKTRFDPWLIILIILCFFKVKKNSLTFFPQFCGKVKAYQPKELTPMATSFGTLWNSRLLAGSQNSRISHKRSPVITILISWLDVYIITYIFCGFIKDRLNTGSRELPVRNLFCLLSPSHKGHTFSNARWRWFGCVSVPWYTLIDL